MLVELKEILTKICFCMPQILAPFYTIYTHHTDFLSGPNLSPFSKVYRQ